MSNITEETDIILGTIDEELINYIDNFTITFNPTEEKTMEIDEISTLMNDRRNDCQIIYDEQQVGGGGEGGDDKRYKLLNMKDEHDGEPYTDPGMFKSHADFEYFINWVYEIDSGETNEKPRPCGQKSDIYKLLNMKDEHDGEEYTEPEMFKSHADFDYFINWVIYEIKSDEPNEKPRPCDSNQMNQLNQINPQQLHQVIQVKVVQV